MFPRNFHFKIVLAAKVCINLFDLLFIRLTKKQKLETLLDNVFQQVNDRGQRMTAEWESLIRSSLFNVTKESARGRTWFKEESFLPGMQLAMGMLVRGGKTFYKWISHYIVLPSISLLKKKAATIKAKPGVNLIALRSFLLKAKEMKKYNFQILTDEIILRSGIAYLKKETGYELIGFVNLGDGRLTLTPGLSSIFQEDVPPVEDDEQLEAPVEPSEVSCQFKSINEVDEMLKKLEAELATQKTKLASHFMISTLDGSLVTSVSYSHLNSVNANIIEVLLCKLIILFDQEVAKMEDNESDFSLNVYSYDGSSANRSFSKKCAIIDGAYVYGSTFFKHQLIFITDPVHLIKRIRNQTLAHQVLLRADTPVPINNFGNVVHFLQKYSLSKCLFQNLKTFDDEHHGLSLLSWNRDTLDLSPAAIMRWPAVVSFFSSNTIEFLDCFECPTTLQEFQAKFPGKLGQINFAKDLIKMCLN